MNASPHLVPPRREGRAEGLGRWPGALAPRFFLALTAGLVWLGPAWWDSRFGFMMVAWDALLLLLLWIDWTRLPRPQQLTVAREWSEPASLGVSSTINLEIRSEGQIDISVQVEDEVPPALRRKSSSGNMVLSPCGAARVTYEIQPRERGEVRMGRVFVRYRSQLQFAERRAVADLAQTVCIYPNLAEAGRLKLHLLRSQQIEMEKRLQHRVERGREFESLREYRDGDELRDICWTATARRAKLVTKVYRPERSQPVWLVLDAGRLMRARAGAFTKLDHAVTAALGLAQVAMAGGDVVGLLVYGRKVQAQLPAARGSGQLRGILDQLAMVRGEPVEADHGLAADLLLRSLKRRSLVIWLTDLAETAATPEVIENAGRLLPHHVVLFVALGQPDLESFLAQCPGTTLDMYRAVAGMELAQRREVLLRRLHEHGALALEIMPSQLSIGLVNQYLRIKEEGRL